MNTTTIHRAALEARRKWLRAVNYPREFEDPDTENDRRYRQCRAFENEVHYRMCHYDRIRKVKI